MPTGHSGSNIFSTEISPSEMTLNLRQLDKKAIQDKLQWNFLCPIIPSEPFKQ